MGESARFANVFAPVFQKAAQTATDERQSLMEQIDALRSRRQEIDSEFQSLEEQVASLDEAIAVGLAHAARESGIKLNLQRGQNGTMAAQKPAAGGTSDENLARVLNVIPEGRPNALTFGGIRKAVGNCDQAVVASAVKRLLSEDKIKPFGERRAKRYFR